jgi:FKBP-type peptidyl-prolyl cis-trans isomerase (trigger factor)
MAEATATCRRELDLEIPADEVSKKMESVAKEFARVARVPGFRPGKAPVSLIRRRFAEDIKGEVVQSLVPQRVEQAVSEQKLTPVSQPHVEKLDFSEGQPLKFRAVFEVLPEFEVKEYKGCSWKCRCGHHRRRCHQGRWRRCASEPRLTLRCKGVRLRTTTTCN